MGPTGSALKYKEQVAQHMPLVALPESCSARAFVKTMTGVAEHSHRAVFGPFAGASVPLAAWHLRDPTGVQSPYFVSALVCRTAMLDVRSDRANRRMALGGVVEARRKQCRQALQS